MERRGSHVSITIVLITMETAISLGPPLEYITRITGQLDQQHIQKTDPSFRQRGRTQKTNTVTVKR
jgi:hypothetical protein